MRIFRRVTSRPHVHFELLVDAMLPLDVMDGTFAEWTNDGAMVPNRCIWTGVSDATAMI